MDTNKQLEKDIKMPLSRYFYWLSLELKSILYLPVLIFKDINAGLYKILIIDKYDIPIYTGYTWSSDEYRISRRKRIKKDIEARQMETPKGGYRIKIISLSHVNPPVKINEIVMWSEPDFNLTSEVSEEKVYPMHNNIFKKIKNKIKKLKEKKSEMREKEPLINKIVNSMMGKEYLFEASFINNKDECVSKCFAISDCDFNAYSTMKRNLKDKSYFRDFKEVVFKTYEKESFGIVWLKNELPESL
jgi:hypothetical protein